MTTITAEASASTTPVVTIAGPRATIRLNRPAQHNRIEPADLAALHQAFERIDADPSVRALVITGTGKSFSSGYHIGALIERQSGESRFRVLKWLPAYLRWYGYAFATTFLRRPPRTVTLKEPRT